MEIEWECSECGYRHEGKIAPRVCPACGAEDAWEKTDILDDDEYEEVVEEHEEEED